MKMKLYIFLLCFAYSFAFDFNCLKGPSFWCANEKNAVKCGRITECSGRNDGVMKMLRVEDNNYCKLCREVITTLESGFIKQFTEDQFVSYVVNNVCQNLDGDLKQLCINLVKQYGHNIYEILKSFIDPKTVCSFLQLCSSTKNKIKSPEICSICKQVFKYMEKLLAVVSPSELKVILKMSLCKILPPGVEEMCNMLVDGYTDQVYELLKSLMDGDRICPSLHLCSTLMKSDVSDWRSQTCLDVITVLKKDLTGVNYEQVAEVVEAKVCQKVPDIFKGLCKHLIDENIGPVMNKIHSSMTPIQICAETHGGSSSKKEKPVENMDECEACELIVKTLSKLINTKEGQRTIINLIKNRLCKYLGKEQEKCVVYTEKYAQQLIDFIETQLTERRICEIFGVCSTSKGLLQKSSNIIGNVECDTCNLILNKVKTYISNPVHQFTLKNFLKITFCPLFQDDQIECQDMVDMYFSLIIYGIINELDSNSICKYVGFCTQDIVIKNVECKECEVALNEVIDSLTTKFSKLRIETFLTKIFCQKVHPMEDLCSSIVKEYIPLIFAMARESGTSSVLCSQLNLCLIITQKKVDSLVTSLKQKSNQCDMCQFVIKEVVDLLSDSKTQTFLETLLKSNICPRFGSRRKECENDITKYYSLLVSVVLKAISPQICTEIQLCESLRKVPSIQSKKLKAEESISTGCIICPRIYMFMRTIDDKTDNTDIILGLANICGQYSDVDKQRCLNVLRNADLLVDSVKKAKNEVEFCEMIKMCPKNTARLALKHCSRGPGFWCISRRNAQFCGIAAVRHCELKAWKRNATN